MVVKIYLERIYNRKLKLYLEYGRQQSILHIKKTLHHEINLISMNAKF